LVQLALVEPDNYQLSQTSHLRVSFSTLTIWTTKVWLNYYYDGGPQAGFSFLIQPALVSILLQSLWILKAIFYFKILFHSYVIHTIFLFVFNFVFSATLFWN
jgi:hypothetical protein